MKETELKLCPFCGDKVTIHYGADGYTPYCRNDKCIAYYLEIWFDTYEEAVEAWNRRADHEQRKAD